MVGMIINISDRKDTFFLSIDKALSNKILKLQGSRTLPNIVQTLWFLPQKSYRHLRWGLRQYLIQKYKKKWKKKRNSH